MACAAFWLKKKKLTNLLLSFLAKTDACIHNTVYSIKRPEYCWNYSVPEGQLAADSDTVLSRQRC